MLIAEVNNIVQTGDSTSWTGRLYDCELREMVEFGEDDSEIVVERLVHNRLENTHNFESDGIKTVSEIQQITEDYYGV